MPSIETIHENDKALAEMYAADVHSGTLTEEDADTYRELIDAQRESHRATRIEVRDTDSPETSTIEVRSVGDAALHNALAVHSKPWMTEEK